MPVTPIRSASPTASDAPSRLDAVLAKFEAAWRSGSCPRAEDWLDQLDPECPVEATELIYLEYCLAESGGHQPSRADFSSRFPAHRAALARLFELHDLASEGEGPKADVLAALPEAGDEIGPYHLVRELGRGSFARVFLAEQADLDGRLVVVKVTTRPSPESRLLARARHAHIVEVLGHATANDGALHLVCMPFLGGATLGRVNAAEGSRRKRPRTGRDLLARLDRVSAPEMPASDLPRPTREMVARSSYARAVAWIFARLAEALDHAYRRGVAHGDIKPSNILLTADAVPMLFDFNLAVDHRDADAPAAGGGTLAYMSPERLLALASSAGEQSAPREVVDLHRSDLYALGLVLVETLAGVQPAVPAEASSTRLSSSAATLAHSRAGGVTAFPDWSTLAIPAGLRRILARCLAPNPRDRYADGRALAEDLDRWRKDLPPLVAADAPFPARVARLVRKRRLPVAALAITLVAAAVATAWTGAEYRSTAHDEAQARYDGFLDKDDTGLFGFHAYDSWTPLQRGDPVENASRKLNRYRVLDDPGWRRRDAVCALDAKDRDDLELLMLEQVYRLASAWAERENSPGDWQRALALLDRECRHSHATPLEALRRELRTRLNAPESTEIATDASTPSWVESYLLGVSAERDHARAALGHFGRASEERPDLLWPHYRAASAAWRLTDYRKTATHLRAATALRPENPALHTHLCSTLFLLGRLNEADSVCERALTLAPDYVEAYESLAFLEEGRTQPVKRKRNSDRYALLTRFRGRALPDKLGLQSALRALRLGAGEESPVEDLVSKIRKLDPTDPDIRVTEAIRLHRAERFTEALTLLDAVVLEYPEHLKGKYMRGVVLHSLSRSEWIDVIQNVLDDPRIEEFVAHEPETIRAFNVLTDTMIRRGRLKDATAYAERGLSVSLHTNCHPAEMYYYKARAHAASSRADLRQLELARESLVRATQIRPELRDHYWSDVAFVELRSLDPGFLKPAETAPGDGPRD